MRRVDWSIRKRAMRALRRQGWSLGDISWAFGLTPQRVHQLLDAVEDPVEEIEKRLRELEGRKRRLLGCPSHRPQINCPECGMRAARLRTSSRECR
jgi:hypothetical protein